MQLDDIYIFLVLFTNGSDLCIYKLLKDCSSKLELPTHIEYLD